MNGRTEGGLRLLAAAAALLATLTFAACNGESKGPQGRLSLQLSGAVPRYQDIDHAWLEISGITVKQADGGRLQFGFDNPRRIDLATLGEAGTTRLLAEKTLPAGRYDWLHLHLNTKGKGDTYLVLDSGVQRELMVPSEGPQYLRIERPFRVPPEGTTNLTVHFDLRHPMRETGPTADTFALTPALRLVPTAAATHVMGTIGRGVIDRRCGKKQQSALSVHVFEGADVPVNADGNGPQPLTAVDALPNGANTPLHYGIHYLPPGTYTIALACASRTSVRNAGDDATFVATKTVETRPGDTIRYDFIRRPG